MNVTERFLFQVVQVNGNSRFPALSARALVRFEPFGLFRTVPAFVRGGSGIVLMDGGHKRQISASAHSIDQTD